MNLIKNFVYFLFKGDCKVLIQQWDMYRFVEEDILYKPIYQASKWAGPVGPVAQPGPKWLRYRLSPSARSDPLSLSSPAGLVGPTQEKNFIGPLARPGPFRGLLYIYIYSIVESEITVEFLVAFI